MGSQAQRHQSTRLARAGRPIHGRRRWLVRARGMFPLWDRSVAAMKFPPELDKWRVRDGPYTSGSGDDFGMFIVPGPCGRSLRVIASPGDANEDIPWEHVSVSLSNRCPNWPEMDFIKRLFWDDEEAV